MRACVHLCVCAHVYAYVYVFVHTHVYTYNMCEAKEQYEESCYPFQTVSHGG